MKLASAAGVGAALLVSVAWSGETRTRTASSWSRRDLVPITQPASAAGNFVFYAAHNRQLDLVAVHARNGSTAWSQPATPSLNTPGVPPELVLVGNRVIYLRRVRQAVAQVVAADAVSGRELWHSEPGVFGSWPEICADDPSEICLSGTFASAPSTAEVIRLDSGTGKATGRVVVAKDTNARGLGPGLYDPGRRNPELIEGVGARVNWRRTLASIFTLPGASTDWGWDFDHVGRAGLFVGTPGWPPDKRAHGRVTVNLAQAMTAGFGIRTGAVAWRDRGSRYVCGFVPCAGGHQAGFTSPGSTPANGPSIGIRLRERGTVTGGNAGPLTPSPTSHVTVEGFALATGKTVWTFDAGHNVRLLTLDPIPPQVGLHTIVMRDRNGRLSALDLGDGSHDRLGRGASPWCRTTMRYRQKVPYPTNGGSSITTYVGQYAVYACDVSGHRTATPRSIPGFVGAIGALANGVVAWSDVSGVFGRSTS